MHVARHVDKLDETLRDGLDEDVLPDPGARGIEDMRRINRLLPDYTPNPSAEGDGSRGEGTYRE